MKTKNYAIEERNTKRIILLASTIVVLVVSSLVAYILISFEIKEFKNHLKIFKSTLVEREKSAIKSAIDNLINDIKYDESSRLEEIKKRVKNQTNIAVESLHVILSKKKYKQEKAIKEITDFIKNISDKNGIDFFVFKTDGTLLFSSAKNLKTGENYINLRDIDNKKFVEEIVKKSGFVDFLWFVPINHKISKRITYSKKIDKLGLVIGSAEFLDTKYSLSEKIVDKIYKEKFSKNNFIFIYEIMSLSSSKNYSKLVLEKNIKTSKKELNAIEDILEKSEYRGDIFYEYDDKLIYSSFLFDNRTFISAGVYLNSIKEILKKERDISHENLIKKITSLIINIMIIIVIFFMLSYIMAEKIERMFKAYHDRIASSQQLLMQKSKMASMGEMIANIAHQWRQPLARLSGFFLDIESAFKYKELDEKYLSNRINQANDVLEYMSKTIDDFKEFYNPNSKEKSFCLIESINSAMNIIDSSLRFYGVSVQIDIKNSLHVEGCTQSEFSQVILNILANTKDIAIQRNIKNPEVKIYTKINKKKKLKLFIEDNCGGVSDENLEKIFEPYFTTKYEHGTGIGLYMCKIIVENKLGGKISAKNLENNFFRFSISFKSYYM